MSLRDDAVSTSSSLLAPYPRVKRDDYVRIILQALQDLGYEQSGQMLIKESAIKVQSESISDFCSAVLTGDWARVESLLLHLTMRSADDKAAAQFLVYEQKYLELLEQGQVAEALACLRTSLTPLNRDHARIHKLTGLLICTNVDDVKAKAMWDGAAGISRSRLLEQLKRLISTQSLLPARRLEQLVLQALELQKQPCIYHNVFDESSISLLEDHKCTEEELPCIVKQTLVGHTDEVWYIQFSHNGHYLASVSKDKNAIIWSINEGNAAIKHILQGHIKEPSYLAWSPNDAYLLTAAADHTLKLWDVATGACAQTYTKHTKAVTSCAWMPDGRRFISGGLDAKLHLWDINGEHLKQWNIAKSQINDLAISPDGHLLVIVWQDKHIQMYDLIKDNTILEEGIPESASITSLSFSEDGSHLLVNVTSPEIQEIHCWNVRNAELTHKYRGHKQSRYVIRSGFGGVNQSFIVSGSEDNNVYIWNRKHTDLLFSLPGHTGIVNSVAWHPRNPYILASCSDDSTVRIWASELADSVWPRIARKRRREERGEAEKEGEGEGEMEHQSTSAPNGHGSELKEEEEEKSSASS